MFEDQAQKVERKAIRALNEERSWLERHPVATMILTLLSIGVCVALTLAVVKG